MSQLHTKMKYAVTSALSLGIALLATSVSQAAFTGLSRSTQTAVATTSGVGTVAMAVSLRKTADNSPDTQVNWAAQSLPVPGGYAVASTYIQLDSTITALTGGIQIYTDNKGPGASPTYTGVVSSVTQSPAGLVNLAATTQKLPTAWTIQDAVATPAPANPNAGGFAWLFHEDRAQVANNQGASNFVDGDPYITVENACAGGGQPCIHFGQATGEFGPAGSPNFIYTQADFSTALAGSTYRTSTLRLEAFTQ